MKKKISIQPELVAAFELFLSELQTHLSYLSEIIEQLSQIEDRAKIEPISAKRAELLEHRFHRIRGGASFLGLTEIAEAAKEGEELSKISTISCNSDKSISRNLTAIVTKIKTSFEDILRAQ